jgi:hypothetical protein
LDGTSQAGDLISCCAVLPPAATETCRLAGYADVARFTDDLMEWNYGEYEGFVRPTF